MARDSKGSCSSSYQEGKKVVVPKTEASDYEFPQYTTFTRDVGDNVASSSGSKLRSFFIGMGFTPSLVDKVIEENATGEDNADLLLEALIKYSDLQRSNSDSSDSLDGSLNARRGRSTAPNFCADGHSKKALQRSNSQSSDSLDSLFDDKRSPEIPTLVQPKEEELDEVYDNKRASLLAMNFSVKEVEFAISKLGEGAPVHELVDFIVAAQIAEKIEKETEDTVCEIVKNESNNEKLFGTMEKTLQLLGMGFSENEVSCAIDRLGAEAPIGELAYCIVAKQNGIDYVPEYKHPITSSLGNLKGMAVKDGPQGHSFGIAIKTESFSQGEPSQLRDVNLEEAYQGKRVKEEGADEFLDAVTDVKPFNLVENREGKRPKPEYFDDSSSSLDLFWVEEQVDAEFTGLPNFFKSNPSRGLTEVVAKPPYFLFGILSNISYDSWGKISQFLYAVEPEFVNTQVFSAISRNEGYVHNLPAENRFHVLPKSPMTIEDAIPHTKKWWPSWDTRKHLSCINCETNGVAQHCDRLGRILADSGGVLTPEKQHDILHYCRALNLIWIGKRKLGPIEAEHVELILGYPLNHTHAADIMLTERLRLLKYCFQTDTLGYHLSVLKPMFPGGLTVLSIFSGIGGAEVALHRLGIKMKAVVSVETSETNRKILKRWWQNTGQTGELVQIEGIQRLTSSMLDNLIKKFGSFDLVTCQNPCTYSSTGIQTGNFDFTLFYEFVRVLQRVRSFCDRK